jgi:hypothetical protein
MLALDILLFAGINATVFFAGVAWGSRRSRRILGRVIVVLGDECPHASGVPR